MKKNYFLKTMKAYGDAYVNDEVGMATVYFNNKYIRTKHRPPFAKSPTEVLVWSWTNDQFMVVNLFKVKKLEPLSAFLDNFSKPVLGELDG